MIPKALGSIAALLTLALLATVPVSAEPITVRQVVHVVGALQSPALRLRDIPTDAATSSSSRVDKRANPGDSSVIDIAGPDSVLSGVALSKDLLQNVEISSPGDIDAIICDCGEITVAGGVPKWPLLFLGALPLLFLDDDCDDCDNIVPTPSPFPTPTASPPVVVPEPGSILLLGSGLLAAGMAARRRYRSRLADLEKKV